MIIDCHTHCYPEEVSSNPREWAEARGELHWAELVAPTERRSIQDWAGPERFLAEMDRCGVNRSVLLGWYWEHESTCRWHNEVIARWVRQAPKRFIGFAAILPNENVIEQLESAKAMGLRGVGELHPGVQGFDSENPCWQKMARWCSENNWAINCHATSESGKDHPSSVATPLKDYVKIARDYPELKLVLAHFGGGLPLRAEEPLPRNLYFDCAAIPLLYSMQTFRQIIDRIGSSHILYGSDYPLRVYPRKQKSAEMMTYLEAIRGEAGLSEAEMEAILGGNIEQVIGKIC